MKTHHYNITTKWTGNTGSGTSKYNQYSRNHLISGENKSHSISGSADSAFLGDPEKYNPEELLLSSISSCHMLWYLHLCASNHVVVTAYFDHAEGVMEELENGSGKFKEVILYPQVTVQNETMTEQALKLHEEAHKMCFIANSCNFKIGHKPSIIAL